MNMSPKGLVLNEPDLAKYLHTPREIVGRNAERWYWRMQIVCESLQSITLGIGDTFHVSEDDLLPSLCLFYNKLCDKVILWRDRITIVAM